ncbi:hypothetical protein E2X65_00285 [Salmonella enterica]|nr:hypothetical protein [Salmonella enterica]
MIIYLRDILIFYNNTGFFMATVLSPSCPHVSRFLTGSDRRRRYTQNHSRCIAAAREEIPGSIDNYVTGVSERSQQRGSLKDEVYKLP